MKTILKDVAIVLTECDIKKFNQYLTILNYPSIPFYIKQEAAIFVKSINEALKTLCNTVDERDFSIFYNSFFENKNRNDIANALDIDTSSVTRIKTKVLKKLSLVLYPELHMLDMFG